MEGLAAGSLTTLIVKNYTVTTLVCAVYACSKIILSLNDKTWLVSMLNMGSETALSRKKIDLWTIIKRDIYILNIGLGIGYILLLGYSAYQGLFIRADFTNFYTGGAIVRDGLGKNLYDQALQTRYQQQILNGLSFQDGVLMYNYPPYVVFPFAVLSLLPIIQAYWVWTFVQICLFIWLLKLLRDLSSTWRGEERRLMLSAVFAFPFLLINFIQGALSLFMLICLVQFYLTLKNRQDIKAGIWFMLSFVKPQNVLLIIILLISARRWKTLAGSALTGLALFGITTAFFGWRIWLDFVACLIKFSSYFDQFGVAPEKMYNFKGTLTLLLGGGNSEIINLASWFALALVGVLVLFLWLGRWQPEDATSELRLAFTLLSGLIFSLHLYGHDGLLLILPALLFYIYHRERGLSLDWFSIFCLSAPYIFVISEYLIGDRFSIRIPVFMMGIFIVWSGKYIYKEYKSNRKLIHYNEEL
jgi:hypothetical protein